MATLKIEAECCDDINCPYLCKQDHYSPDPFEGIYTYAKCTNPSAKAIAHGLGCDRDDDYCKIPEWCPLRTDKKGKHNQMIEDICNLK